MTLKSLLVCRLTLQLLSVLTHKIKLQLNVIIKLQLTVEVLSTLADINSDASNAFTLQLLSVLTHQLLLSAYIDT